MTRIRAALIVLIAVLAADPAAAATSRLARIVGSAPLVTYAPNCPGEARCRLTIKVRAGERVILAGRRPPYAMITLTRPDDQNSFWAPLARLRMAPPPPAPTPASWVGRWRNGDDTIDISRSGAGFAVQGAAYWPDAVTAPLHSGTVRGTARLHGDHLSVQEGDCRVTLTRFADWLEASDNGECGGVNVRFAGLYFRDRGAPAAVSPHP